MAEDGEERSLALTPTWSVAVVLTVFVVVSLLVERGINRLSSWLQRTNRKPLFEAVEKMKEEMMLLGFISLLLVATSSSISNICIKSKFYNSNFSPCSRSEVEHTEVENEFPKGRKLLMYSVFNPSIRRVLNGLHQNNCRKGYEPFVSFEGLEQLHRFIFVMAVTHVTYSCLTMLLAIVKVHTWRKWEDEAHIDRHDTVNELTRELTRKTLKRQSTFVNLNASNPSSRNRFYVWLTCFFRQFGRSVVHADYLTLRLGFITNHHLTLKYDFHSYMVRSMEEEFQKIVGVSGPLWGFVIAFMLFNVKGSNLYFWIAIIPITLVLVVGTKLQHVIATLALENAGIVGFNNGRMLRPRDDLFWFKKPELLLNLIHFILFQNAFELASFFWFWWQFGYRSCFISNHLLVYIRLILGFAGQFLCSYSTLPLYALVTQMGTNYKAALIPQRIRETIQGWKKSAKRKRRLGMINDDSTIHTDTDTCTVLSLEDDERHIYDVKYDVSATDTCTEIELQSRYDATVPTAVTNGNSSQVGVPFLRASASLSYPHLLGDHHQNMIARSSSMPVRR